MVALGDRPGEDGRGRRAGHVGRRRRVAEPGGVPRQRRQVRVEHRVDALAASSNAIVETSSNTTITTGTRELTSAVSAEPEAKVRSLTGEKNRKIARNTAGAGDSTVTKERSPLARA